MRRHVISSMALTGCLVLGLVANVSAATIYLCKAYSGGYFWAKDYCQNHQATLQRAASVPDTMSFEQQIAIGEQQRAEAERLSRPSTQVNSQHLVVPSAQPNLKLQCKAMDAEIARIDQAARQGQSAQGQEQLRMRRSALRDQQYRIGCGRY